MEVRQNVHPLDTDPRKWRSRDEYPGFGVGTYDDDELSDVFDGLA